MNISTEWVLSFINYFHMHLQSARVSIILANMKLASKSKFHHLLYSLPLGRWRGPWLSRPFTTWCSVVFFQYWCSCIYFCLNSSLYWSLLQSVSCPLYSLILISIPFYSYSFPFSNRRLDFNGTVIFPPKFAWCSLSFHCCYSGW